MRQLNILYIMIIILVFCLCVCLKPYPKEFEMNFYIDPLHSPTVPLKCPTVPLKSPTVTLKSRTLSYSSPTREQKMSIDSSTKLLFENYTS